MSESFFNGRVQLHCGDCLDVLAAMTENSIDSCVTDPPYHLTSIVKRFGSKNAAPAKFGKDGAFARTATGFMGKQWDGGDVAFDPATWTAVLRVLKPGAHLLAFGGTRTYHRMACAIEDAGFEIRDCVQWIYGSGFPKSHDVSKGIDRAAGAERKKVRHENPRNPKATGGGRDGMMGATRPWIEKAMKIGYHELDSSEPATAAAREWEGWGTALKPACEPIVLARKPLSEKTVAANVLRWGTGAINVDGCRVAADDKTPAPIGQYGGSTIGPTGHNGERNGSADKLGRWPANVIHDGSAEVIAGFPETATGFRAIQSTAPGNDDGRVIYGNGLGKQGEKPYNDSGSAARLFYTAKADGDDRLGSKHPTVKPLDLMQYLVRLITPPKGLTLDPFAGTGTTGEAAFCEGMRAVLIERETEYQADIRRRMKLTKNDSVERKRIHKNPDSVPQETLF